MSSLEKKIDDYFASASTEEVIALLERSGLEKYRGGISLPEYLAATGSHIHPDTSMDVGGVSPIDAFVSGQLAFLVWAAPLPNDVLTVRTKGLVVFYTGVSTTSTS